MGSNLSWFGKKVLNKGKRTQEGQVGDAEGSFTVCRGSVLFSVADKWILTQDSPLHTYASVGTLPLPLFPIPGQLCMTYDSFIVEELSLSPLEMLIYKSQKLLLSSITSSCGIVQIKYYNQQTKFVSLNCCLLNPGVRSLFSGASMTSSVKWIKLCLHCLSPQSCHER